MLKNILKSHKNQFNNISIYFKENNVGFLKAHHWMKTLDESYLSDTQKGGGALCEHSHALNLAQFLLNDKEQEFEIIHNEIRYSKINQKKYLILLLILNLK